MVPAALRDKETLIKCTYFGLDLFYIICILGSEKQKKLIGKVKDVGGRVNYGPSSFHYKEK